MSTPHIEHFVDERGNFIYRAEFEGSFLSKDEAKELGKYVSGILDENHRLRELVRDMWHDGMCECDERGACAECEYHYTDRMRELGVDA